MPTSDLDHGEKVARLRLIRSENVGPITFRRLMERFKIATDALSALPEIARRGGKKTIRIFSLDEAEAEIGALKDIGGEHAHLGTSSYPPLLSQIEDAPPVLTLIGHRHLLTKKAIAIVGARNASTNGKRLAQEFAATLGAAGYLVISGMARGIDTAAHNGALQSGTIAVTGGGADVVYPRENAGLHRVIVERGAVVSEMPVGTQPKAMHFPRRNRIISGMSRGIVVVEAGAKSGSLITARMALEQGREVFAVPGAPQDPRVKGTNSLIRDGAMLTESTEDVLSILRNQDARALADHRTPPVAPHVTEQFDPEVTEKVQHELCRTLGFGPTDIDDIIRETEFPASVLSSALLELEVAGRVERLPGNKACLIS